MRSPQSQARSVPGWPPISIGCCASGVAAGQGSPWSSPVPSMGPFTYARRPFVVGAANAHELVSSGPRNWSATLSMAPGDPLPSHRAIAWTPVQPSGNVNEYPYVSEVNVVICADGDGDGEIDGEGLTDPLGDPVEQATRATTARIDAERAAMAIFTPGLRLT